MEQKIVKKLENEIEGAIADVIMKMGLERLPLLPSRQTMHLMSKAECFHLRSKWKES